MPINVHFEKGYYNRFNKVFEKEHTKLEMQSNGCLMRASALALATNFDDAVDIDVDLTNPNIICKDVVKFYVDILRYSLDKQVSKSQYIEYIQNQINVPYHENVQKIILDVIHKKQRNITEQKGWILHGLYCALYALFYFDTYTDGINYVIQQGGDTDTNGAITGALLGCFYGYQKLEFEQEYNIARLKECDSEKLKASDFKHCYTFQYGLDLIEQYIIHK